MYMNELFIINSRATNLPNQYMSSENRVPGVTDEVE